MPFTVQMLVIEVNHICCSPGRRSRGGGGRGRGRGFDYPFNAETRTLLEQLNHRGARGDWEEIVDRAQDLLERDFAPLLQYTLEVDLEDSWVYIVKEKPPWTPFTLLSVVKQNDGSLTDQGFPSMIQVGNVETQEVATGCW